MADRDERIIEHLRSIPAALDQAMAAGDSLTEYEARTLVTRARAAVDRFSPPGSAYTQEATMVERSSFHIVWKAEQLCAIVAALRDDYEYGGLESVAELVHADLFDDFLEIADELRSKGFMAPAAVVAGSVLEEHLRKLADKRHIARLDSKGRPKSAETLSVELRRVGEFTEVLGEFTEVQRKSVQAWYTRSGTQARTGSPAVSSTRRSSA